MKRKTTAIFLLLCLLTLSVTGQAQLFPTPAATQTPEPAPAVTPAPPLEEALAADDTASPPATGAASAAEAGAQMAGRTVYAEGDMVLEIYSGISENDMAELCAGYILKGYSAHTTELDNSQLAIQLTRGSSAYLMIYIPSARWAILIRSSSDEAQKNGNSLPPEALAAIIIAHTEQTLCDHCGGSYYCGVCLQSGRCPSCNGVRRSCACKGGNCIICEGTGYVDYHSGTETYKRACTYCYQGRCKVCDGLGYLPCTTCGDTGRCPVCGGLGHCSYCDHGYLK